MLRHRSHTVTLEARCSNCSMTKVETFDYVDRDEVERAAEWPPYWLSFAAPFWVDNFWEKLRQTQTELRGTLSPVRQIMPRDDDPLFEEGGAYLCPACVEAARSGLERRRQEIAS